MLMWFGLWGELSKLLLVIGSIQGVSVGDLCMVEIVGGDMIRSEVVGFKEDQVLMMPLGLIAGIRPGSKVYPMGMPISIKVGPQLLGRVLNGLGEPIDGKGPIKYEEIYPIDQDPPDH